MFTPVQVLNSSNDSIISSPYRNMMIAANYIRECVSTYMHRHMRKHVYMRMCMKSLLPSVYSENSNAQMWDMCSVFLAWVKCMVIYVQTHCSIWLTLTEGGFHSSTTWERELWPLPLSVLGPIQPTSLGLVHQCILVTQTTSNSLLHHLKSYANYNNSW